MNKKSKNRVYMNHTLKPSELIDKIKKLEKEIYQLKNENIAIKKKYESEIFRLKTENLQLYKTATMGGEVYVEKRGRPGISHETKVLIFNDYKNSDVTFKELADKYSVSPASVRTICNGEHPHIADYERTTGKKVDDNLDDFAKWKEENK
jgi:Mor family transcriptional regulator